MFVALILVLRAVVCLELPRGVPLSKSSFYTIDKPFTCLDGSTTISWSQVNDDYCDCQDGSDEPGTAACPNGVFYCRDIQYKIQSIKSMYVNDGFCDCCDGSDEYNGRATCESTCGVLAAAVQQAKSIKRTEIELGHKLFKEYVEQLKLRKEQERMAAEEVAHQAVENQTESENDTSSSSDLNAPPVSDPDDAPAPPSADNNHHDDSRDTDEIVEAHDNPPAVPPKPEPKPVDYGPEGAFQMLDELGKCVEFTDLQYTYELCGLREIFQRELTGSGQKISLGKWDEWTHSESETMKEHNYGAMRFTNGLMCWNGPARSTKVYVHCGPTNEIISMAEPSRCEYVMHLRTPAACSDDPDTIFKRLHPDE